jgi:hypothetical protein
VSDGSIKITSIRAVVPFRLVLTFSDGAQGTFDAASLIAQRGEGNAALREHGYFAKVELANGVPTWPNHFDISPSWLYEEMHRQGSLVHPRRSARR